MLVSPLLSVHHVESIHELFERQRPEDEILGSLKDFSVEEKLHLLRFLYHKPDISRSYEPSLLRIWFSLVPPEHKLDTNENREALDEIGKWWETFGMREGMSTERYDLLEQTLDALGKTEEGREFFQWVLLSPVGIEPAHLLDDYRRGAVVCLGKYCPYDKSNDLFLARHLDDQLAVQVEVVSVLHARRSRLFGQLGPWYLAHDRYLKPNLEEYF